MKLYKHLVALPVLLSILTACDSAQQGSDSALHETPSSNANPSVTSNLNTGANTAQESALCNASAIANWSFYDYCACVDGSSLTAEVIDERLGAGATESMRTIKKVLAGKTQTVIAVPDTEIKGKFCLATGLLFERSSGSGKNAAIRRDLELPGRMEASVLNRRLPLAKSGITSPQPLLFLNKLGTGTSSALVSAVDLSYNNLSDTFFAPLRTLDWLSKFGVKELDLSNNQLESTIAVDFDPIVGSGKVLNSVDLAYNKIKLFEAWQGNGRVGGLSYLNLSHNPDFKAVGHTSSGVEVKLGNAIRKTSNDTSELFLDLSDTATDSLAFDDTTRVFSGLNLDNLKIKADARIGLKLPSIPGWFTARNSKNIAKAIAVDSGTSSSRVTVLAAYLNVDGATGLDDLHFLKDITEVIDTQIAYVSAVGSDLSSFSNTPLDLNSIEFFSVDGSAIQSLGETFASLKYASSTGIKDAHYLSGATALEGAVIDASLPCPSELGTKCKLATTNGLGRLPEAGISNYVDKFCTDTFGSQNCLEAAKGIIGGTVTDTDLAKKADEYIQNWCKSTFDNKSCELAANVAP